MAILALTTLDAVKAYATAFGEKGWDGATFEAWVTGLIARASAAIQKHLNRELLLEARTRDFDLARGQRRIFLPASPVTVAPVVKVDAARVFGSDTVVDATTYAVDSRLGVIEFDDVPTVCGAGVARVTWTGGLAATAADLIAAYPDIAQACELTIQNVIQRRLALGGSLQGGGQGGSATYVDAIKILPVVADALRAHWRPSNG